MEMNAMRRFISVINFEWTNPLLYRWAVNLFTVCTLVASIVYLLIGTAMAHLSIGQDMLLAAVMLPLYFCLIAARRYMIRSGPEQPEIPEVDIDL
ncbi:hypothetical protein [Streptomyces sp. NPDC046685]|uniref:hypothetical protein n=1 Tax=Streptomyces sp. NPDC046685 TaxID=3157202 RepID=UPI0033FFE4DF